MKGLLIKDWEFLVQQRKFFFLMLALAIGLSVIVGIAGFALSYYMIVGFILSMSIFTTDEMDNGYAFLFSLPLTRQMYVKARYLYAIGMLLTTWVTGLVLSCILNYFMEQSSTWTIITDSFGAIAAYLFCLSLLLPLLVRYGSQKARLLLFMVLGGAAGFAMGVFPIFFSWFDARWSMTTLIILIGVLVCVAGLLSYRLSLRLIEKREF